MRRLKEQFINGINDWKMTATIIKELTLIKDTSEIRSKQVLPCNCIEYYVSTMITPTDPEYLPHILLDHICQVQHGFW